MSSAGNLQLCAGHAGECEAAVHAMSDIFDEEATEALLLVDAGNAFNSLYINRSMFKEIPFNTNFYQCLFYSILCFICILLVFYLLFWSFDQRCFFRL